MQKYKQLTLVQRYGINLMLKQGLNIVEISISIGVHKSTISRELHRNRGKRGYRYKRNRYLLCMDLEIKCKLDS